jgi:hypothetical protein
VRIGVEEIIKKIVSVVAQTFDLLFECCHDGFYYFSNDSLKTFDTS